MSDGAWGTEDTLVRFGTGRKNDGRHFAAAGDPQRAGASAPGPGGDQGNAGGAGGTGASDPAGRGAPRPAGLPRPAGAGRGAALPRRQRQPAARGGSAMNACLIAFLVGLLAGLG